MRFGASGALVAGLLVIAPPSLAQEDEGSPFRFLKPWIERQLFGTETPETNPEAAPVPPAEVPPAAGESPPEQPPSIEGATAEPDAGSEAPAAAAPGADSAATLRGSVPPAEDLAEPSTAPAPEIPPADAAEAAPETAVEPPRPQPLRFAVLAGRSPAATMAAVGAVADELSASLGRPVEILPLTSYGAMVDAQVQRRVDGGFYSSAAYAVADSRCACLEPLAAPKASDGTLAYHAIIVARAGSGIASAADLAGKTVAIGAPDSLGSRRLQLAGLLAEGIDPATFAAVIEVESAEAAVSLVAAGAADAAFAWSSLAGAVDRGYSRGTLTDLVTAGKIAMANLTIVWRSPAVGHGPFAVLRTLPEEEKRKIESALVALSAANPAAYDALDPFYGGGYAPVDPRDYSGLETLLAQNLDALRLPKDPGSTGATAASPGGAALEPGVPQ